MRKEQIQKILLTNPVCYLFYTILFLEILVKIKVFQNFHFFYPTILGLGIAMILGIFIIYKHKYSPIIFSILLLLLGFYYCAQILYHDFFKMFMTIYSLGNGGQIAEFYKDAFQLIIQNIHWVILSFIPFLFYVIKGKKYICFIPFQKRQNLIYIGCSICVFIMSYFSLYLPSSSTSSALDIYKESTISEQSVNRLGMMTSLKLDLSSFLFGKKTEIDHNIFDIDLPEDIFASPQIMNIDFEAMKKATNNKTILKMHDYFQTVQPTYKNEYTGMFKDYNLILMTCEGFSPYAVNKDVTPTLYKMAHEGFVFNNFYTPIWGVSTSDGEYVHMQSLIPKSGVWSFEESSNNALPFVMGQQFKKMGYTTKAYHNHSYKYYGRNKSHPNLGYDYKAVGHGLNIRKTWPESDLEMIEKTVGEYINEDKFHTYYMTVSGHTNYTWSGNSMATKNKNAVKNLNYSELAKGYLATQIELDKAMEKLLKELKKAGKDQNTLIVMSADHYPYGLPEKNYNELAGHKIEKNFELYKNVLIIYSPSMKEPIIVDKAGSSLDILPTISNLLGIEYDSRLLMGRDILSNSEPLIIFSNKSFITDKVQYNSQTDEAIWLNGVTEDKAYLKRMQQIVKQKFQYSEMILDYNYYKTLKYTKEKTS